MYICKCIYLSSLMLCELVLFAIMISKYNKSHFTQIKSKHEFNKLRIEKHITNKHRIFIN